MLSWYGGIEINPGHKQSSLAFCHWNLNVTAAHDFVKISLIQGYITERNIDILYNEDDRLKIEGYDLIRLDHPSGLRKGGK